MLELPQANLLIVGNQKGAHSETGSHGFPVRRDSFRRDDDDRALQPSGHGAGNIGFAGAGVAGVKCYSVLEERAFDVVGMFFLVYKEAKGSMSHAHFFTWPEYLSGSLCKPILEILFLAPKQNTH